jgi:hypothetical protein
MTLRPLLLRLAKASCILGLTYVFIGICEFIKSTASVVKELDQLSDDLDCGTGPFDKSVILLSDQVHTLCYEIESILDETWIPDTLKEMSRNRINALRDGLELEDYVTVKIDLSILESISDKIEELYDALEPEDTVKIDQESSSSEV